MNKFPVVYFEDNLIFNSNGDCWAIYKMSNFDYDLKKTEQKISILHNMSRFLANAGVEVKILVVPTIFDCKKHLDMLRTKSKPQEISRVSEINIDYTLSYLEDKYIGSVNEYNVYILTNMKQSGNMVKTVKDLFSYIVSEPIKALNDIFGVDTKEIPKRKLRYYKRFQEEYYLRQNGRIRIEPVNAKEIELLIKRVFHRGIEDELPLRKGWKPRFIDKTDKIIPYTKDIMTLSSGIFNVKNRVVSVKHLNGKVSYQTFMPIAHIPDNMAFPGSEFFMYLQCLGFPVECCINMENIEHQDAIKKIEKKRKEVKAQIEHIVSNSDDVPTDLSDAREFIGYLEDDLKEEKAPLINASIVLCVYAEDMSTLEERYKTLEDIFGDMNFQLERPISDQEKFFMEFVPGSNKYVRDFNLLLPPKTLAGSMFGATTHIGDDEGSYIGYTSNLGKPVFLSLLHACQINKSASAFVWGALGYGKSFNTNLLVYLHVLNGAKAFIVDPKNERKMWIETIPELSQHISITTFGSSEDDMGKLDPFLIREDDLNEAGNLAVNIIAELFKLKVNDDRHTVLVEAIEKVKHSNTPCMDELVEVLDHFPERDELKGKAKSLSRMIKTMKKPGLSGLLYGERFKKRGLGFKHIINIVEINGLQLPLSNKSKDNYSTDETISTVLMLAVANYAKRFAQIDNSMQKIVVMDEAWSLAKTEEGKNLFEILARTGRSLNTSTIFIGHSATDIPTEGIRNAITYKFCFNVGNRYEAAESLKLLDMEESEENLRILSSTESGLANAECIFTDAYGRKGRLVFDAVFEHLEDAFKTTPEKGSELIV